MVVFPRECGGHTHAVAATWPSTRCDFPAGSRNGSWKQPSGVGATHSPLLMEAALLIAQLVAAASTTARRRIAIVAAASRSLLELVEDSLRFGFIHAKSS
eukprot:COSAG02_NODE_549_length_20461_cov_11.385866_25_plen_99_part_01